MPQQSNDEVLNALQHKLDELAAAPPGVLRDYLVSVLAVLDNPLQGALIQGASIGRQPSADPDFRATLMDHLAWIESIRSSTISPWEDAAVEGRAAAIRLGMRAGLPGSAFVRPTALTLARIYQIRDGRR